MRNLTEKGPDRCAILDNPDILGDCIDADGINEQRAAFDKRLEYKEKKGGGYYPNERDETLADTCGK